MGHTVRTEVTKKGKLIYLADHYMMWDASKPPEIRIDSFNCKSACLRRIRIPMFDIQTNGQR